MKTRLIPASKRRRSKWRFGVIALFVVLGMPTIASAQSTSEDAARIVKAMSDYVGAQKTISFSFDSDIEVVTPELQKIQFASSGTLLLNRPNKLRATRTGGYTDVELVSDGKTMTINGKNIDTYAQTDAPDTIDKLIEQLRDTLQVPIPGADLLLANSYDELMSDVYDGKYVGRGGVDGVECEHLAFRKADVDWQIWIAVGNKPIPHKYVITSKAVAGAPQYILRIKDWRTDVQVSSDAFSFKDTGSQKKVAAGALSNLDEVPPGMPSPRETTGVKK